MPRLVALSASSAAATSPAGARNPPRVRVNDAYVRALQKAGLVPLIVPPSLSLDDARAVLAAVDGVVMSGGEDVDPACYGALPHPATQVPHPSRDASEVALIAAAREAQRPVLAICRGIQLLNVALGGTLVQDLPAAPPGIIAHVRDEAATARVHGIDITAGSRLATVIGARSITVNSMHHQAVDRLASQLRATAFAPDGVIEAAETTDAWWVLAVQWHPEELMDDPMPWDRNIFAAFAEACAAHRAALG